MLFTFGKCQCSTHDMGKKDVQYTMGGIILSFTENQKTYG